MQEVDHLLDHNDGPVWAGQPSDLDCLDMHNPCLLLKLVVPNLLNAATL